MNMTRLHTKYELEPLATLVLRDACNSTIGVVSGSLWLTMEGDARDIVLEPGTSFTVDRDGLTVLAAQSASVIEVREREKASGWWARFVDIIDRTYGPAAIRPSRKWVY